MKIDIVTIFPEMFSGPLTESILKRASDAGRVSIGIHNLRDFTADKHKTVDARPYGGGPGMVLMVEPVYKAVQSLLAKDSHVVALTPKGQTYNQNLAKDLSHKNHLILLCGHYEGFDQRILDHISHQNISIGPYVLTGGEIPAMCIADSVVRLIPGVLGDEQSVEDESHQIEGQIEYPHYTRPEVFNQWAVPKILLSGHHQKIKNWRKKMTKKSTD